MKVDRKFHNYLFEPPQEMPPVFPVPGKHNQREVEIIPDAGTEIATVPVGGAAPLRKCKSGKIKSSRRMHYA